MLADVAEAIAEEDDKAIMEGQHSAQSHLHDLVKQSRMVWSATA